MDIGGLDNTILTIGVSEGLIGGRDGPGGRVQNHIAFCQSPKITKFLIICATRVLGD